jgi:hypothetical protein
MITASGRTADITVDGGTVTITRHRSALGVDAGTRTIPISQITALQWKKAGRWSGAGYIRLLLAGSPEHPYRPGQILQTDVLKDPNAVPFDRSQQAGFEAVKDAIEAALARGELGVPTDTGGIAQQIVMLADLHLRGVLSDQEFEAAKAKLIGQ